MSIKNQKKMPLYVEIYDKLLKLINEGVYPVGSKLPAEAQLSKMMNVSRMTLRQALSQLQEDGYLQTIHGQGNFVKKVLDEKSVGIEKIDNTVLQCCTEKIDDIEATFQISFVDDYEYVKKHFKRESAVMIQCERWYKNQNSIVAYSYTLLPSETASQYQMNLNDHKKLLKILEEDIHKLIHSSTIEIRFTETSPPSLPYELKSKNHLFVLLIESLLDSLGNVLLVNKIYIPTEYSSIKINRINK